MRSLHTTSIPTDPTKFAAFLALDWADRKHAWALQPAGHNHIESGELENTPEAVETFVAALALRFPQQLIAVALEQSRGSVIAMLSKYAHLVLFPVHPQCLASYRKSFFPSGAKDDPRDANLLLDMLRQRWPQMRSLQPDTVETRTLQFLVEQRRVLVNDKAAYLCSLTDALKQIFPQILRWFEDLDTCLVKDLLQRWPTLQDLKKARPSTLTTFFHRHNCRNQQRIQQRVQEIREAVPATSDPALLGALNLKIQSLLRLIAELRQCVAEHSRRILELTQSHPDYFIVASFPGAGDALEARLLAALGTQRERFTSAASLASYAGIAPVTEQSGKQHWVHWRWACPKFVRQTFHEWALHSIAKSEWAAEYYQVQRSRGKSHHAAVRALAFKWIRILYRCWKDRVAYCEQIYQLRCRQRSQFQSATPANPLQTLAWKNCGGFSKPCLKTT